MSAKSLLTLDESERLATLEKLIESGRKTWVAAGEALIEIRERKLYRTCFKTFEEYCRDRWGWTKQHAYRLIECAPIAKSNLQVTSQNQARELAKVPEYRRPEIIRSASAKAESEERPMTAKDIKEAAEEERPHVIAHTEAMPNQPPLADDHDEDSEPSPEALARAARRDEEHERKQEDGALGEQTEVDKQICRLLVRVDNHLQHCMGETGNDIRNPIKAIDLIGGISWRLSSLKENLVAIKRQRLRRSAKRHS